MANFRVEIIENEIAVLEAKLEEKENVADRKMLEYFKGQLALWKGRT